MYSQASQREGEKKGKKLEGIKILVGPHAPTLSFGTFGYALWTHFCFILTGKLVVHYVQWEFSNLVRKKVNIHYSKSTFVYETFKICCLATLLNMHHILV